MPNSLMRRSRPQFLAVAVLGLVLAAALAGLVMRAERARARSAFQQVAQRRVSEAEEHLHSALDDLVALRALMHSVGVVDRQQFDVFCDPLLREDPAIQALEWIPAVSAAQRAGAEQRARRDGFARFAFTAQSPRGMVAEPPRDVYFPVYYVAPYVGNEKALGFDLASNPARRSALQKAAATGAMVATSRIVLVQSVDKGYGVLVFLPVYPDGAAPGHGEPLGFVLGVFKVARLLSGRAAAAPATTGGVNLAVFDATDAPSGSPGTALYPRGFESSLAGVRASDMVYERTLDVGGRHWQVLAYGTPSSAVGFEAALVFASVLVATLLFLALMRQTMLARESDAQREIAQRSDAAKSQFLANVSHEMRTPLNGVVGMLDLLLQSSLLPHQTRMAEISRRSAINLLDIIGDLLDFSKMESGRFDIAEEAVDLRRLCGEIAETFQPLAAKAGCSLRCEVDPALPAAMLGDEVRLRQIMTNLVSNAIKFSGGRGHPGSIDLRARAVRDAAGQPAVAVDVADNGIGIDAATLPRLFQPFEQADLGTTKRYGGTGLGLSICHHLVELMGGRIDVHSRPGAGSTFTVTLPLRPTPTPTAAAVPGGRPPAAPKPSTSAAVAGAGADPATRAAPAAPTAEPAPACAGGGDGRVLVAEDNEVNREVIRLQLGQCGIAADIAEDGARALALFRQGSYRLVLTDLHMPELDGFGLARAIRAFERETGRPRAAVLAVTAAAQASELERALDAGMDGHLTKPIRLDLLREALVRWLGADPALPRLDVEVLRTLVGADQSMVASLLRQYLRDLEHTLGAMRSAASAGDWGAVGTLAHRLKSSSRTVGAARLGQCCDALEASGRSGDAAVARRLFDALQAEAAAVAPAATAAIGA